MQKFTLHDSISGTEVSFCDENGRMINTDRFLFLALDGEPGEGSAHVLCSKLSVKAALSLLISHAASLLAEVSASREEKMQLMLGAFEIALDEEESDGTA